MDGVALDGGLGGLRLRAACLLAGQVLRCPALLELLELPWSLRSICDDTCDDVSTGGSGIGGRSSRSSGMSGSATGG